MKYFKKSVAFWGAEPPPLGGMTVHIKRLSLFLKNNNWTVIQYNFNSNKRNESYIINVKNLISWYLGLWIKDTPEIHYVITTRAHIRFLASLLTLRGKKVVIRVGGENMENELVKGGLAKLFNVLGLKLCSAFIGVSKDICNLVEKFTRTEKIHHIPGFIPPQIEHKKAPEAIRTFFDGSILKLVVTGQIFSSDSKDIYGIYHFLNAAKLLKNKGFEFKAVIVIYGASNSNFKSNLHQLKMEVNRLELKKHILVFVNNDEFWPILKKGDVFIRPSITDGDSNTIREALFLKKYVIASNCVSRPESCILYENLNSEELTDKIISINMAKEPNSIQIGNQNLIEDLLINLSKE